MADSLLDGRAQRKARGAFFTPSALSQFMVDWAIRSASDSILEPSTGDAAFLISAVERLRSLSADPHFVPTVDGVEIHEPSARRAMELIDQAGGVARLTISDFFLLEPQTHYDAVVGNPPYIRYQDFAGAARARSRESALRAGVSLTALASSWAAFTVHSALFLKPGGRLALVLPAELLSVNYAAEVRRFLFESFDSVELVLFEEQVFSDAETDVVLLLADGFRVGSAAHASIYQTRNAASLTQIGAPQKWTPVDPASKWTGLLVGTEAVGPLDALRVNGDFIDLESWGDTTLGMVTGANKFFALSPARVNELNIDRSDLLPLSPPGSSHLRGLSLTSRMLDRLGDEGRRTWLFRPSGDLDAAASAYVWAGLQTGVDQAYKCRVRKPWYQVPILPPADLLLTCMNADTPRLTSNPARAHHLNSVHGVYLNAEHMSLGTDLLPIASINSITMLNAEMVGRAYGGGVLKIEPREADVWAMPSPQLVRSRIADLVEIKPRVARLLADGNLRAAVGEVDRALFADGLVGEAELKAVRNARDQMAKRRADRGRRRAR